mgnify:CR=1 FL=1
MKVTVEELNPVQKRVCVTLPLEVVNKAFDQVYSSIQRKSKVQGFRPGKAPIKLIHRLYSQNAALQTSEILIRDNLGQALVDQNIRPIAQPVVENSDLAAYGQDYDIKALVDILPKIDLNGRHKGLNVRLEELKIDDSSLEKELKNLARRHVTTSSLDQETKATAGHLAEISLKAFNKEGSEIPELAWKSTQSFLLGTQELHPDFEKAILGLKLGESAKTTMIIPQEASFPSHHGEEVTFELHLAELAQAQLPTMNDDFAKDLGSDSMEQLKQHVQNALQSEAEKINKNRLQQAISSELIGRVSVDVPPALVDSSIDEMIKKGLSKAKQSDLEQALANEELRQNLKDRARNEVHVSLLMGEIIRQENLQISDDEVKSYITSTFLKDAPADSDSQIEDYLKSFGSMLKEQLLIDKVFEFIKSNAMMEIKTTVY